METLKNFIVGISVLVLSLLILVIIAFTWPLLIGISSFLLSAVVIVLFVILIFYIIVLVGYFARKIIGK